MLSCMPYTRTGTLIAASLCVPLPGKAPPLLEFVHYQLLILHPEWQEHFNGDVLA